MLRSLLRSGVAVVVAAALSTGCAEENNSDPVLVPLDDTTFRVNQQGVITIRATDPDGDPLTFSHTLDPEPRTQTMGETGQPQLLGNIFVWTPGIADAGDAGLLEYALTITVEDDQGGSVSETLTLRVVSEGVGGSSALRFIEPPGAGMAVDLSQKACIDELRVRVKADAVPDQDVEVFLCPPVPDGARLSGAEKGKERVFFWCPSEEQLDRSLSHLVTFCTREVGGDAVVQKRFSIRFQRTAAAGCAGAAPVITHRPPGTFSGPLNYEIEAIITDDVGFKDPPFVQFTVGPDPGPNPDTSGWQVVNMTPHEEDDSWTASIPNLNLPDGESANVHYQIVATDNDDPDGTRCDHTSRSALFRFTATGGGGGGGASTYGFCEACVGDEQCGGAEDRCMLLRGESFCGRSCENTDCSDGQQCYEFESIDGVVSPQCLPIDLNCGQLCVADAHESGAGNDELGNAVTLDPGRFEGSICAGDPDYFAVPVAEGQSIRVTASFVNERGDLDLAMALQLPEDPEVGFDYQSLNGDVDSESVHEPCAPATADGEAIILVFGYEGSENTYDLDIEVGPGDCANMCQDDVLEPNDVADDFTAVEVPFDRGNLQLCRRNDDYFGFEARAGEIISVSLAFTHADGDIDLRLYRGDLDNMIGQSRSYRDAELIEAEAPMDDIYIAEVYGATRSVANAYSIAIETRALEMCQTTVECPVGSYCAFAGCSEDACQGFGQCAGPHGCVTPRAGLDPAASGGRCAAICDADLDCRDGFDCKRFEDFSKACAPSGAAQVGERCAGYQDCAGDQVCYAVPGGYCAAGGCEGAADCPAGTVCGTLLGLPACLRACNNNGDCRAAEDYECREFADGLGCTW